MTREEAKEYIYECLDRSEATEVIEALEQESCEDCISRQAVIKHICESKECYEAECKGRLYKRCYDIQWVYDLPPVTPQPKIGEWIYTGDYITEGMLKCSECGFEHDVSERFLYCPKCGIKMEVEE